MAGNVFHNNEQKIAFCQFLPYEILKVLEGLKAIEYSLESLKSILKGHSVLWKTDNFAASIIVKSGSSINELQLMSFIFDICKENKIPLTVNWISRKELKFTDALSRIIGHDDWQTKFFSKTKRNTGYIYCRQICRLLKQENKKELFEIFLSRDWGSKCS